MLDPHDEVTESVDDLHPLALVLSGPRSVWLDDDDRVESRRHTIDPADRALILVTELTPSEQGRIRLIGSHVHIDLPFLSEQSRPGYSALRVVASIRRFRRAPGLGIRCEDDTVTYDATETSIEYQGSRVRLHTNARFEAFVAAFEQAVPELSNDDAVARLTDDADWSGFVRGLQWEAPSGFVRVWSWTPAELMRFAGSPTPSAVWSIVNHGIGARLFRHDPGAMIYSPLRIEAHAPADAGTIVTFDVPSAQFRGFGINKVTQAGAELDRALGDLWEDLGLPRPAALRR